MEEIKIIHEEEAIVDLSKLSYEEREQVFEQMAAEHPEMSNWYFEAFKEMNELMIKRLIDNEIPTIFELLLRKLIEYTKYFSTTQFSNVIWPVIPGFAQEISVHTSSKVGAAAGPRFFRKRRQIEKHQQIVENSISISFDTNTLMMTQNNIDYINPANENISIIGLIINQLKYEDIVEIYQIRTGGFATPKLMIKSPITFEESQAELIPKLSSLYNFLVNFHQHLLAGQQIVQCIINSVYAAKIEEEPPADIIAGPVGQLPKNDILSLFGPIAAGVFNNTYLTGLLADLDNNGLLFAYNQMIIYGKDNKAAQMLISKRKTEQLQAQIQAQLRGQRLIEVNKSNMYFNIILSKFGPKKLAEIKQKLLINPHLAQLSDNILEMLKPAEKKLTVLEYNKILKHLDAVINNKCSHLALLRKLAAAKNIENMRMAFEEISKIMDPKTGNCKLCKYNILCPHAIELIKLELSRAPFSEIKAKMTEYIEHGETDKESPPVPLAMDAGRGTLVPLGKNYQSYFCKLCGEMLSQNIVGDIYLAKDTEMDPELANFIWGEVISMMTFVKTTALNLNKLVTFIRDEIYTYIYDIENQIIKSKTNTAEEIKAKRKLFTSIYIVAYIIHLIFTFHTKKKRAQFQTIDISFRNVSIDPKDKNMIVNLIKHGINLIIMSKNIIIRQIPGMMDDIIKNKLVEAYKIISNVSNRMGNMAGVQEAEETEPLETTLLFDPLFAYYYKIWYLNIIIGGGKIPRPGKTPRDTLIAAIEPVLGADVETLAELPDGPFSRRSRVKFDGKWKLKLFNEMAITTDARELAEAHRGYIAESFKLLEYYIDNKVYLASKWINIPTVDTTINVKISSAHEEYEKVASALAAKEEIYLASRARQYILNFVTPAIKPQEVLRPPDRRAENGRQITALKPTPLARIFDESGNPHSWSSYGWLGVSIPATKYIMGNGATGPTFEATAKELAAGSYDSTIHIIDKKCGLCGLLETEIGKLSEIKIEESLKIKNLVGGFFRYYDYRCPVSSLHEYERAQPNQCKKCGYNISYSVDNNSAEAIKYFKQYQSNYLAERDARISDQATFVASVTDITQPTMAISTVAIMPELTSDVLAELDAWKFNFNTILDLSNKIGVNQRLIQYIGAYERQEYNDIVTGTYIPAEIQFKNDTRMFIINSYIKMILTEYNMIRYYAKLTKPPAELIILIDNSGIPKGQLIETLKKLPIVGENYFEKYTYIKSTRKARELVDYCIQSMCEILLNIIIITVDDGVSMATAKLRNEFVKYVMWKILNSEELLTKPGHFNWSLLYEEREAKTRDQYDMNLNAELEKEVDKYDNESEEKLEEFGDTKRPLDGIENFDIDTADLEEGESPNDVRVGEDLGLT